MIGFLHHLFLPKESNNFKARVLHQPFLLGIVIFLLLLEAVFGFVQQHSPDVLGITANMTVDELLNLTNQKRAETGLPQLALNSALAQAAQNKGNDMFVKNYWAHNSPDGGTPWGFIKSSGYDYIYAGENLARGFSTAPEVVEAWMASPGHRENMLSQNYRDIGFAILTGNLSGDDTVLVVEMFGSPVEAQLQETASEKIAAATTPVPTGSARPLQVTESLVLPTVQATPTAAPLPPEVNVVASIRSEPLINVRQTSFSLSVLILGILIGLLLLDVIIIEKKRIVRSFSHNLDHIIFLTVILIIVILISGGIIL